ncbi:amidase [Coralliovum pocilloporae]|uniref:amidase n=1 Tax=Coralliovum pocilloporae TaxID=3066369 RepID=UPI003306EA48
MPFCQDTVGAFVDYPNEPVPHQPGGPLDGLTFAVKDLFDVVNYPTGCGHPLKQQQASPAQVSAPVVQQLLDAGARFTGKTITDELAFSLTGQNIHYGTPENVMAPGRIPGGSSSGSAAAVAAGLCDFAIGTDTGGSIRAPASYCGLVGLRPTHGRLSLDSCMPMAPSLDAAGWFARDIATYLRVADVLLGPDEDVLPDRPQISIVTEAFDRLMGEREQSLFLSLVRRVETVLGEVSYLSLEEDLETWWSVFRTCQGYEVWQEHGAWITEHNPDFGPGVKERFQWAATVTAEQKAEADATRKTITRLMTLAVTDSLLIVPTMPSIAPRIDEDLDWLDRFRNRSLSILCLSGLSGLPQVSLPLGKLDECPFALSLIGPHGTDQALLHLAGRIMSGIRA